LFLDDWTAFYEEKLPEFLQQNPAAIVKPLLQPEFYDLRYRKHVLRQATLSRDQKRALDILEGSGFLQSEEEAFKVLQKVGFIISIIIYASF
jgi:hypothetical protein